MIACVDLVQVLFHYLAEAYCWEAKEAGKEDLIIKLMVNSASFSDDKLKGKANMDFSSEKKVTPLKMNDHETVKITKGNKK